MLPQGGAMYAYYQHGTMPLQSLLPKSFTYVLVSRRTALNRFEWTMQVNSPQRHLMITI